MALKDWVRHEGTIESVPNQLSPPSHRDETYVMLVREIQFQDVKFSNYNKFPTLYDVALSNRGRTYIPVTDNTKLVQDPPNPILVNSYRKNNP